MKTFIFWEIWFNNGPQSADLKYAVMKSEDKKSAHENNLILRNKMQQWPADLEQTSLKKICNICQKHVYCKLSNLIFFLLLWNAENYSNLPTTHLITLTFDFLVHHVSQYIDHIDFHFIELGLFISVMDERWLEERCSYLVEVSNNSDTKQ